MDNLTVERERKSHYSRKNRKYKRRQRMLAEKAQKQMREGRA